MNEVSKVLKRRRSYRSYRSERITDEELNTVLEAGTYAPMVRGQQSPVIVAAQNPAVVEQLRKVNAIVLGTPEADPLYGMPTVLTVLAARDDTNRVYDDSCIMNNLMNAAKAMGLVSCRVHRAKEVFDSEEGKALLRQWGVKGDYEGIGHCIPGYRVDTAPAPVPRKEHYIYRVRQRGKQVPRPGHGVRCLQGRDRACTR